MTIVLLAALLAGVPGDMNGDDAVDLGDAVYLLSYVFAQGPPPPSPVPVLSTGSDLCPIEELDYDTWVPCPGETEVREGPGLWTGDPEDLTGRCMGDKVWRHLIDCGAYVEPAGGEVSWCKSIDGGYRTGVARAYRDGGDGTVTDLATGLTWTRASVVVDVDLPRAVQACEGLVLAGRDDWRLPTVAELLTLVDWSGRTPAIAPEFDVGAGSRVFWTSTVFVRDRSVEVPQVEAFEFWTVEFARGRVVEAVSTSLGSARAVRGGGKEVR